MRRCLWLPFVLLASIARAEPISVSIIQASYHGTLEARILTQQTGSGLVVTQQESREITSTSAVGIVDAIDLEEPMKAMAKADVTASLFSIMSNTSTGRTSGTGANATATVGETIDFRALQTTSATVGFSLTGPFDFSTGSLRLTDLTTAAVLWSYGWNYFTTPTTPTVPSLTVPSYVVTWSVATDFLADRSYRLDLFALTNSGAGDAHRVTMQVSGLEPADITTPEPSTLLLCLAGVAGAAVRRRRALRRH